MHVVYRFKEKKVGFLPRLSNVKRCKLLALGAAAVLSLGLMAGCGSSDQSASSGSGKNYKIGIVQLVCVDAANKGFVDGLRNAASKRVRTSRLTARMRRPTNRTSRTSPSASSVRRWT